MHPINTITSSSGSETLTISEDNPLSASYVITSEAALSREGWYVSLRSNTTVTATKDNFNVAVKLEAFHETQKIFSKTWKKKVKRVYV